MNLVCARHHIKMENLDLSHWYGMCENMAIQTKSLNDGGKFVIVQPWGPSTPICDYLSCPTFFTPPFLLQNLTVKKKSSTKSCDRRAWLAYLQGF